MDLASVKERLNDLELQLGADVFKLHSYRELRRA